jgi:predicted metal-dependent phosphoesterase TrpH
MFRQSLLRWSPQRLVDARRHVVCDESHVFVRGVAERLRSRVSAPAERDSSARGHHELAAFRVDDGDRPCQLVGTVLADAHDDLAHAHERSVRRRARPYNRQAVALRVCLVTPFTWSQPHEVNDHVAGLAAALRARGHEVTVLAPSGRAADLLAGRRALARGERADVIALGPAVPVSRRSHLGVAVGLRANLRLALRQGAYDVVHGFEPGLPSISALALAEAEALTAATFLSPERLGPSRRSRRDRLRARVDALLATSADVAEAASERYPGDFRVVPAGVDVNLFRPAAKRDLIALQLEADERSITRAAIRVLDELEGWELIGLHTKPLSFRPVIPARLRARVHTRTARREDVRAGLLAEASIFVPTPTGHTRLRLEAAAAGCAIAEPPGANDQPELVTAAVARLGEDTDHRKREAARARAGAEAQSFDRLADELDGIYGRLAHKRRPANRETDPLADREWILVDLHMHTRWSHDCSIEPSELIDHAEEIGLGAIAVTDHNVFGGALETADLAIGRDLVVVKAEEVKTDGQGEVIGLFLSEEIPRGMSFADTIAAIREQGGVVYLPHPFDRMHAIPDPATLHRHVADIDVFEVYNARLLRDSFNDEALRFARKYRLLQGAGSDAHVLQGVGTGALRMRRFDGPEEFLLSLRTAEVLRRPKSLAYLQSLKWVAQARDKLGAPQ